MKVLLKILLFPITMLLSLIVFVCRILCAVSGTVLMLLSMLILAIAIGMVVVVGAPLMEGLKIAGLAYLISPFGIPFIATALVEVLGGFNKMLKTI